MRENGVRLKISYRVLFFDSTIREILFLQTNAVDEFPIPKRIDSIAMIYVALK